MKLDVISPTSSKTFDINWIEVHSLKGSFVVLEGHAPTIVILTPNKKALLSLVNGEEETIDIPGGILQVERTKSTLLISKSLASNTNN